jgi:hypothetical protein
MPLVISGNVVKGWRPNALSDGNVALPAISFNNSTTTGIYHAGNGVLGLAANGTQIASLGTGNLAVSGNVVATSAVIQKIYHLNLYTVPSAYLGTGSTTSYSLRSPPLTSTGYYYLVWGSNYNTNFTPIIQNTVQYKVPVQGLYFVRLTFFVSSSSDHSPFISKNKGGQDAVAGYADLNAGDGLGPVVCMSPATGYGGAISAIIPMTTSDYLCFGFYASTANLTPTARTSAQITLIGAY